MRSPVETRCAVVDMELIEPLVAPASRRLLHWLKMRRTAGETPELLKRKPSGLADALHFGS